MVQDQEEESEMDLLSTRRAFFPKKVLDDHELDFGKIFQLDGEEKGEDMFQMNALEKRK